MLRSALLILCVLSLSGVDYVRASSIKIESINLRRVDERYVLDANVALELNSSIARGLTSGVPLIFNLDVNITQKRRFWWDKQIATFRRRYTLVYYELTRHYRVSVDGEDITKNFRSLLRALDYLGRVRDMPLFRAELLGQRSSLIGEIELFLDGSSLPVPLRPQTLVSSDWRLRSQEYRWPIN